MFSGGSLFRRARHPVRVGLVLALGGLGAALLVALQTPAQAATGVGYDVSYPQCNKTLPSGGAFGIVGVNGGLPYSANPCLGTGNGPSELSWAGAGADLYANTADPGSALSSHWPNGQTSPKPCNTATNPGAETPACHYDYGWNAAADSYKDAVAAEVSLGWVAAGSARTVAANRWWLDVETANSWTSNTALNIQALQGAADYLVSVGSPGVGFYSVPSAWASVTGSTSALSVYPTWLAGASSLSDAQSRCGGDGFTGGGIALVQFISGGFDNDYYCTSQPPLSFGTAAQTLKAAVASSAITVQLPQPAAAAVTVSLTSSSTGGSFATSAAGPWTATLNLAVPSGGSVTASFYYRDSKAGSPVLSATAPGYNSATQTERVKRR